MKPELPAPLAILAGSFLIAAAIYFHPAAAPAGSATQALYDNGYVYIVDLKKGQVANMIPVKQ